MPTPWYDFPSRLRTIGENARVFGEDDLGAAAGREAEEDLAAELNERIHGTGWYLATNVRVPDMVQGRGRELDFVLVGPEKAFVLDLKHWSGSASLGPDGTLVQVNRYGDEKQRIERFMPNLQESADVLIQHNAVRGRGIARIIPYLVFDDLQLTISDELAQHPNVLTRKQLLAHLPPEAKRMSWAARLLWAIIGFLTGKRPGGAIDRYEAPTPEMLGLRATLEELNTWDTIKLHGGKTLRGDILDSLADRSANRLDPLDRRQFAYCEIKVERDRLKALLFDPSEYAQVRAYRIGDSRKEYTDFPVRLTQPVRIHIPSKMAGGAKIELALRNLRYIEFGYQERSEKLHDLESLAPGDIMAGKVSRKVKNGVQVDVGRSKGVGARIHAYADANNNDAYANLPEVGRRVLVKIKRIFESGKLSVEVLSVLGVA